MKNNHRPNYGLDAPRAVRNLFIVAALGIISLITRLLGVWSRHDLIAVIARPLIGAGLSCGAMGLWMVYDSKIGKVREREDYLDKIVWRGDERVLDVGCGLGLFLIGAAKRLKTGRAVGIDLWQAEDLSGNTPAGTLNNATIEGVADKVEVHTGDARKLPFDDATFDLVFSRCVLEHVEDPVSVFEELRRVLRPNGHLIFRVPSRFHYVSIAARLTPLRFHRWFNEQRGFGAENFPTFYRINDRSALRQLAGATGYAIRDLELFEIKPSYLVFHPLAYRVGIGYERLVNRFDLLQGLRSNIIGVFEAV